MRVHTVLPSHEASTRNSEPKHCSCQNLPKVKGCKTKYHSIRKENPITANKMASVGSSRVVSIQPNERLCSYPSSRKCSLCFSSASLPGISSLRRQVRTKPPKSFRSHASTTTQYTDIVRLSKSGWFVIQRWCVHTYLETIPANSPCADALKKHGKPDATLTAKHLARNCRMFEIQQLTAILYLADVSSWTVR